MTKTPKAADAANIISLNDMGLDVLQRKTLTVGFAQWIRSLMQNWRQGTVACKGRSDVAHSNKKPWKQKGTGRARAGSARSPLWRGGGVTFGPQARVRKLDVPKKVKQGVLNTLLFKYMEEGRIRSLDWTMEGDIPKTTKAFAALRQAGLHDQKITLFLPIGDMLGYASFANIPTVRILFFDQANAFDLANSTYWVVCTKDRDHFKEMVSQWV